MMSATNQATSRQQKNIRHDQFELAKWIAVIAMTVDHYGKIVDPSVFSETNAVGRLAFPLFAWIIGSRLALDASLARRYLRYLVPWAVVTQPVFVWVGKSWDDPNIFFTLAMGVALHHVAHDWRSLAEIWLILVIILLFLVMGADYGVFGLFLIPIFAKLAELNSTLAAWSVGPLGVLSNLVARAPYLGPGAMWSLIASIIASSSMRFAIHLPRLPRTFFYAYYPTHLLILLAISSVSANQ